jgi:4-amino-4-deoxychorismate lyase
MADRVLVTLDGKVQDPEVPLLFADDAAALRGDGVFETLLVRAATAIDTPRHLARLARSDRRVSQVVTNSGCSPVGTRSDRSS